MTEIPIACVECGEHEHTAVGEAMILVGQAGIPTIKAKREVCSNCGSLRVVRV